MQNESANRQNMHLAVLKFSGNTWFEAAWKDQKPTALTSWATPASPKVWTDAYLAAFATACLTHAHLNSLSDGSSKKSRPPMSAISLFVEKQVHRSWNASDTLFVAGTSCPRRFFKLLNHPHPAPRGFWESNPGAATKSPPRKISKLSPNPPGESPKRSPDPP